MHRRPARAFLLAVGIVVLVAPPALAERRSDPSTRPPAEPVDDPASGGDTPGAQSPAPALETPPAATDAAPHLPNVAILGDLPQAQDRLARAEALVDRGAARIEELRREIAETDVRITDLTDEERQSVKRVQVARDSLADRAVAAYVRGNSTGLAAGLGADDPNDLGRNAALMESVLAADDRSVDDYRAARRETSAALVELADHRRSVGDDLAQTESYEGVLLAGARDARVQLAAFEAGSEIFVTGLVFPVADPHNFTDTFGAPRSGGRRHQGVDIFAPAGTNLLSTERGVVSKVGTNSLGGTTLWVAGESGTTYYYAHLRGYAPGIRAGLPVEAGHLLGYVGNTGNAATTPSHLHFEIHPHGGPAVNPTPLLQVVDALDNGADPTR